MANDEFREDQESRRQFGKAKQHEKRLERAVRKAVAEEIVDALVVERDKIKPGYPGWKYLNVAIAKVRTIGGLQ